MEELKSLAEEMAQLQKDFRASEAKYRKAKRWFKPLLVICMIALVITLLLPFLLPITLPVLIAGVILLIIRWLMYKFVYKNPEIAFSQAWKQKALPILDKAGGIDVDHSNWAAFEKEQLDDLKLFFQRIDSLGQKGSALTADKTFRMTFASTIREKITFKTILGDLGEDIAMQILNIEGSYDDYQRTEDTIFFKGLLIELKVEGLGRWMTVPTKLLPLYRSSRRFPEDLRISTEQSGKQTLLLPSNGSTPSDEVKRLVDENSPCFIQSTGNSLWIALPRKQSMIKVHLDDDHCTDPSLIEQYVNDLKWTQQWNQL